jgi:hypothetical protein
LQLPDDGSPHAPAESDPKPEETVQPLQPTDQSAKLISPTNDNQSMTGSEQLPSSDIPSSKPDSAGLLASIPDVQYSDVVAPAQKSAEGIVLRPSM